MKKFFLITTIVLFFSVKQSLAQTNPIYDSIKVLNLNHYASLPVDSFLHVIPQSYDYIKIIGTTRNNALGLCIYYPNNLNIWIQPLRYIYMTRLDHNRVWDMVKFKKETAHYISITHPDCNPIFGQD